MTDRMAYMADMDNPYITLDNNYIETGWWILKKVLRRQASSMKVTRSCRTARKMRNRTCYPMKWRRDIRKSSTTHYHSKIQEKRTRQRIFPCMDNHSLDAGCQRRADSRTGLSITSRLR